jgi:hypothetical protein
MNVNDEVTIDVKTEFGSQAVTFKIIKVLRDDKYLLYAQDRIVVGQKTTLVILSGPVNAWKLSYPVDLLDMQLRERKCIELSKKSN